MPHQRIDPGVLRDDVELRRGILNRQRADMEVERVPPSRFDLNILGIAAQRLERHFG